MNELLPFHKWKTNEIVKLGGYGSSGAAKPKEWFWQEYGRYCNKQRAAQPNDTKGSAP